MYFELFKNRKLAVRGKEIIGGLSWDNELMYTPSLDVTLPINYKEYVEGHGTMKVYVNDKVFHGVILNYDENKQEETITLHLEHIVREWTYRQISVNNAIKDEKVNFIFKGAETRTKDGVTITASPITILKEEFSAMTPEKYIERSDAHAWTENGEDVDVTVDSSKVEDKEGSYDLVFKAKTASVTVKAEVKESKEEDKEDDNTLTASSFSMTAEEVGTFTPAKYIERANASVTSGTITVDSSDVKTSTGTYNVEFTSGDLKVTVDAIVVGEPSGDPSVIDELADIYADMNFAYPGWTINYSDTAEDTIIDYVYSRQNKLEALTKTMELTPNLFWRVRFVSEREIDISEFGEHKQYIVSMKPSGRNNIRMVTDPQIEHDFENVVNVATVYSEKSDSGMSSMTLREVYNDPSLQDEMFPVVILRANVNNERDYRMYSEQYPKLAPNNELEYAVIDLESVALESGELIEGTYAFNDLSPFSKESDDGETEEVTDEDRIEAAKTAYKAAIRKLKEARRRYIIEIETEELPSDLAPGDMVRLIYDNSVLIEEPCSNYMKKILAEDDWYYITKISYDVDVTGAEMDTITLEKELHLDRETSNE